MCDVIHPLRFDVIGPIFGYVPFHTEVELKATFCPVYGVDRIIPLKRRIFRINWGTANFLPRRERSIHLLFGGN